MDLSQSSLEIVALGPEKKKNISIITNSASAYASVKGFF